MVVVTRRPLRAPTQVDCHRTPPVNNSPAVDSDSGTPALLCQHHDVVSGVPVLLALGPVESVSDTERYVSVAIAPTIWLKPVWGLGPWALSPDALRARRLLPHHFIDGVARPNTPATAGAQIATADSVGNAISILSQSKMGII